MMFKTTDNPRLAQRLNRLKRAYSEHSRAKFARYLKEFKRMPCLHSLSAFGNAGLQTEQEAWKEGCRRGRGNCRT